MSTTSFVALAMLNFAAALVPSIMILAFVESPYRAACEAWDVSPATPVVTQPVDTDVPLLMLAGQFDSFSPPSLADAQADRLPNAWSIELPRPNPQRPRLRRMSHHRSRNQWVQDPTTPPDQNACTTAPPVDLATVN